MLMPFMNQIYDSLKKIQEIQRESDKLKEVPESKQNRNFRPDQGVFTKGESSKGGNVPDWTTNKQKDNTYFKTTMPDEYGYDTLGKKEFTVTAKKAKDPVLPDWFMDIASNDLIRQGIGKVVTNIFNKEYEFDPLEKAIDDPLEAMDSILKDERFLAKTTGDKVVNGVPNFEANSDALMRDMFGLPHRIPNELIKQSDGTYGMNMESDSRDIEEVADNLVSQKNVSPEDKGRGISWLLGNFNIKDLGDSYEVYDKWDVALNKGELLKKGITEDEDKAIYALRHIASAFINPSEIKFKVPKKELKGWEKYFEHYGTD